MAELQISVQQGKIAKITDLVGYTYLQSVPPYLNYQMRAKY